MRIPLSLAALALLSACSGSIDVETNGHGGGSTTTSSCIPGAEAPCPCPLGSSGFATCLPDGSGYGDCTCSVDTPCAPGSQESCYEGPPGSADVGICQAGQRTCVPDGSGFGPCLGQVLPAVDLCISPEDEDCNGSKDACVKAYCQVFDPATATNVAAEVDGAGRVHVTLHAENLVLGGETYSGATLIQYGPSGELLWVKSLPGDESSYTRVLAKAGGGVRVFGHYLWQTEIGGYALACDTGLCPYAADLSATGDVLWAGDIPNAQSTGSGEVLVSLGHTKTCPTPPDGVQLLNGTSLSGACLWTLPLVVGGSFGGFADPVSDVRTIYSTSFKDTIEVGGALFDGGPGWHMMLLVIDGDGVPLLTRVITNAYGVARVAPDGDIVMGGFYSGPTDLGAGPLPTPAGSDNFVARFDALGNLRWSRTFDKPAPALFGLHDVRGTPQGGTVVIASFDGPIDLAEGGSFTPSGGKDLVVIRFDAQGTITDARAYGDGEDQIGRGLLVNADGTPIISGVFRGSFDLGWGPVDAVNDPNESSFVCQLMK